MSRKAAIFAVLALVPLYGFSAPVRFRAEIKPAGGITSPDLDGLGVRYAPGGPTYTEIIDGEISYMGIAEVGVEFDADFCYVDLLAGGGVLANGGFASGLFTADVGCRFKLDEEGTVAVGPFVGFILAGDSEWEVLAGGEEGTADLNGKSGLKAGIKLTAGWERVTLIFEAGYTRYGYDLSTYVPGDWLYTKNNGATWTSMAAVGNEVEIEMDGFYGQFGACVHF